MPPDKVVLWYWASCVSLGSVGLVWAGMELCTEGCALCICQAQFPSLLMRVAGVSKQTEDFLLMDFL